MRSHRPARPTYADLAARASRLDLRCTVLEIAHAEPPDAHFDWNPKARGIRGAEPGDRYQWRAYRLAGPVGGYLTCTYHHQGQRPSVIYIGCLEDATPGFSEGCFESGMIHAIEAFRTERQRRDDQDATRASAEPDWMTCRPCGFSADEADFNTTSTPSERVCPQCGSLETYHNGEA